MSLFDFDFAGVKISYYPGFTDKLDHLVIRLAYNNTDDKKLVPFAPLFTDESLAETRAFLYRHNVSSIEINLPETTSPLNEEIPDHIPQTFEILGNRFGELIKSVPSIKTVYVVRVAEKSFQTHLKKFEDHLSGHLVKSLAHPALFMQVESQWNDDDIDARPLLKGSYQVTYEDKRTLTQKIYDFFASFPLLGILARLVGNYLYGDTEKQDFKNAVSKLSDMNYAVVTKSDEKTKELNPESNSTTLSGVNYNSSLTTTIIPHCGVG